MINILAKTWKFKTSNIPVDFNIVVAFWHGKMLPVWYYFSKHKPLGIVSMSRDGSILSFLLKKWNYSLIRGSSSKGGKEVIENTVNSNHKGPILITPDGPRGPKEEMKAGAIVIANKSKRPLVLCGVSISKKVSLNKSWDKFEIPLPFSKIFLNFSDEIIFNENLDYDSVNLFKSDFTNKLLELTKINT